MALGDALGEDFGVFLQDADNDFVTAVAPSGSGRDGKSPRTDFGHMLEEAQNVTLMPYTIDPMILRQGYSFADPAEEEISSSLGFRASNHSNNLRGIESQPGQKPLPEGQSNHEDGQPIKRSRLQSSRRRIDEDEWETKKPIIENLLLQERKTLNETMIIMEDKHQFKASKTAYKNHIKQWDLKKNLPKGLATYLWLHAKQRKDERGLVLRTAKRYQSEFKNRTSRFPKGRDASAENSQQDPTSIEQRLDEHSFAQTNLFNDLGLMPLPDLCNLADRLINRGLHASNDMVLEALLIKLEGTGRADADSLDKKLRYTVSWMRTMVFQRKFLAARKILEGIRADNSFNSFPPIHSLQIHKLALLVDVYEDIHQPQNIENIEARCIALLAAQNAIGFSPDRYWPNNLILAYLFRLYGLFKRELQRDTIDRMDEVIRIQFRTREPSISSVWAVQQYARWCLGRTELKNADSTLKSLKGVISKNSAEDTQNALLETVYKTMRPGKNQEPVAPQIVDIYERNKVDEQWQDCFEKYLWDEPYAYFEDPRMRSRKEQDAGYLH